MADKLRDEKWFGEYVEHTLKDRLGEYIEELVTVNDNKEREIMAKTSIAVIVSLLDEFEMFDEDGKISGEINITKEDWS